MNKQCTCLTQVDRPKPGKAQSGEKIQYTEKTSENSEGLGVGQGGVKRSKWLTLILNQYNFI